MTDYIRHSDNMLYAVSQMVNVYSIPQSLSSIFKKYYIII